MCNPTIAVTAIAGASSYINYRQQLQAQKNAEQAQIRQNELAKKNALQRYASEQLRIRQVVKQSQEKGFLATKARREKTEKFMAFRADRGVAMSGSMNALLADYYRTEGNYKSSLATNLDININQFRRNLEAIQFGQESQSTYVQPPNPELLFASSALNVANTYYSLEAQKANRGLMTNKEKSQYIRSDLGSS
tara:strand:- start:292 stop:870 length:579 start_codon:yes stop_codon:yes gene_type:complete